MSHTAENSSLKMKEATKLETCKKIYFYVILHLLMIKIQQAKRALILEFYDVTCKPAIEQNMVFLK